MAYDFNLEVPIRAAFQRTFHEEMIFYSCGHHLSTTIDITIRCAESLLSNQEGQGAAQAESS